MEILGLSVVGIVVSTFAGMSLGALWYSPLLFGKQWMKCIGKSPETLGKQTIPILGSIVANLATAVGLTIIFKLVGISGLASGITVGLALGVLIVFPALLSDNLFCGWGVRLLLIQSGYRLSSILMMSIILVYLG